MLRQKYKKEKEVIIASPQEVKEMQKENDNTQEVYKQRGLYKKINAENEKIGYVAQSMVAKVFDSLDIPYSPEFKTVHGEGKDILCKNMSFEIKAMGSLPDFFSNDLGSFNYTYLYNFKRDKLIPIELINGDLIDSPIIITHISRTLSSKDLATSLTMCRPTTTRELLDLGIVEKVTNREGKEILRIQKINEFNRLIHSEDGYTWLKKNKEVLT